MVAGTRKLGFADLGRTNRRIAVKEVPAYWLRVGNVCIYTAGGMAGDTAARPIDGRYVGG
jgi:hypothetical protein